MRHIYTLLVMLILTFSAVAESRHPEPLQEGHLVAGAEGKVIYDPQNDVWQFFPVESIIEDKGQISAEEAVPLLPCSTLEQIVQMTGDEKSVELRLWAMVTELRGQNYLYSLYFQPLKTPAAETHETPRPAPDASNEKESVLPDEILQMMNRNRVPDLKRLDEIVVESADRNLVHRTGQLHMENNRLSFMPDAFGQNASQDVFQLLPSKTIENIQRSLQRTPGRQRYIVSGVITQFQGRKYLLVRRAVRTYTNGNFTR